MELVIFQTGRMDWSTPIQLFRELDYEFHFTIDVCASDWNAKCVRYYTIADDALGIKWEGICWMNPPYGRSVGNWMKKAYESSLEGATVVCLVPSRTDTNWWHDYASKGKIRFIKGRVKFQKPGGPIHNAPFPSAIVIFTPPIKPGVTSGEEEELEL